jgi:small subunit ribosomal protein S6
MPEQPPLYDLVLLLSTTAEPEDRAKIVADIEASIAAAGGSVQRKQDWGTRPTTYQINHQAEAEYHLLQFNGPTSLLESMSHSLGIADTVLRFRIIKVIPGTPPPSDTAPPVIAPATAAAPVGVGDRGGDRGERGGDRGERGAGRDVGGSDEPGE